MSATACVIAQDPTTQPLHALEMLCRLALQTLLWKHDPWPFVVGRACQFVGPKCQNSRSPDSAYACPAVHVGPSSP